MYYSGRGPRRRGGGASKTVELRRKGAWTTGQTSLRQISIMSISLLRLYMMPYQAQPTSMCGARVTHQHVRYALEGDPYNTC